MVFVTDSVGEGMAEAERSSLSLEAWLMIGLLVSVVLSTVVIAVVSAGKTTVFSPYENGSEYEDQQLTLMRDSLDDFSICLLYTSDAADES